MLGDQIRKERRKKNKTQEDLAQHLGVQRAVISKYETGAIAPTLDKIKKIAEYLDVSLSELLADGAHFSIVLPPVEYPAPLPSQEELEKMPASEIEYISLRALGDSTPDVLFKHLEAAYQKLNKLGKVEAVIRLRELTACTKFTEPDSLASGTWIHIITSDDTTKPSQD